MGIKVLSLFDGMSGGMLAFKKINMDVDSYYASEVDENAIKVSSENNKEIIHIGDVKDVSYCDGVLYYSGGSVKIKFDLVIGGSPCQGFSRAGEGLNFNDERSKLFFEFLRILNEVKPKFFLLENVNMKKEWQDIITERIGVTPTKINSKLFLPHNRPRTYWTNIDFNKDIKQKDYDIRDYLDKGNLEYVYVNEYVYSSLVLSVRDRSLYIKNATKKGYLEAFPNDGVSFSYVKSKTRRGRVKKNCVGCLTTSSLEGIVTDDLNIRKLSTSETERFQGVPVGYTKMVSDNQAMKMLGNGWTTDVIAYIFSHI